MVLATTGQREPLASMKAFPSCPKEPEEEPGNTRALAGSRHGCSLRDSWILDGPPASRSRNSDTASIVAAMGKYPSRAKMNEIQKLRHPKRAYRRMLTEDRD